MKFTLFHTSGCHLCEQAQVLIEQAFALRGLHSEHLVLTDIACSDTLLSRYGLTIPVLRAEDSGTELNWPFSAEQLEHWLKP